MDRNGAAPCRRRNGTGWGSEGGLDLLADSWAPRGTAVAGGASWSRAQSGRCTRWGLLLTTVLAVVFPQWSAQETFEGASSIGVFVDAGSRHESAEQSGVTHLLENMAFQSTDSFSKERVMYEVEMMGASVLCNRSRETMVYCADVLRPMAGDMTEVLLSCATKCKFDSEEVEAQKKQIIDVELPALKDDPTTQIFEAFHEGALTVVMMMMMMGVHLDDRWASAHGGLARVPCSLNRPP